MKAITLLLLAAALGLLASHATHAQSSPYAGQQARPIKALSDAQVNELINGAGMGLALTAELNSHPGPMHALELKDALQLDAAQVTALQDLMREHKARARALGAEVVRLEQSLDLLFAQRQARPASVDALLQDIGRTQGALRAEHLKTHLATTALLSDVQVRRYDELRGYTGAAPAKPRAHQHHH